MIRSFSSRTSDLTHSVLLVLSLSFANYVSAKEPSESIRQSVEATIAKMQTAKPPSVSSGKLQDGRLEHAAELPKPGGVGYIISHPDRETNFGADRMVFGLMRLGVTMQYKLGDETHNKVIFNEISDRDGGKQERHINHQMGLDVDILFYCTDSSGNRQRPKWISFDEKGISSDGKLRFDVERNWMLLEAIFANETFGEIRSILIAEPLKNRLLEHAMSLQEKSEGADAEKLEKVIKRMIELCRQPESSPHDNHFHLSLKQ